MVFSTILFLFRFLPITLALYYIVPAKLKNTVLFVCSLVFYSWGEVKLFPVMAALILVNYIAGLGMERWEKNSRVRMFSFCSASSSASGCSSSSNTPISSSATSTRWLARASRF